MTPGATDVMEAGEFPSPGLFQVKAVHRRSVAAGAAYPTIEPSAKLASQAFMPSPADLSSPGLQLGYAEAVGDIDPLADPLADGWRGMNRARVRHGEAGGLDPLPREIKPLKRKQPSHKHDLGDAPHTVYDYPAPTAWTNGVYQTDGDTGRAVDVSIDGKGNISLGNPSHTYNPDPASRRSKLRVPYPFVLMMLINVYTETHDFVSAIHKAIPKGYRARAPEGKRLKLSTMLGRILAHQDKINWKQAAKNVISNEIEDRIIGRTQRAANRAPFGGSGRGAGTVVADGDQAYGGVSKSLDWVFGG